MIPNKVELLCLRAQEAMAMRDWEKAKQFYMLALEFRANAAEVHYGLATVCFQLRDMTNAAYHFQEVTRLDPTHVRALINLGATLHQLGELDDAETVLSKGIQLDGKRGESYYLLGLVHKAKGQIDKGLIAFSEALRCNPRLIDALLGMGESYVLKKQPEMALKCYEQALRVRPNWGKALKVMQELQAQLSRVVIEKPEESAPGEAKSPARTVDPEEAKGPARTVDPNSDGAFLTELHQATGFIEHKSRLLQKILAEEVAPALVELSRMLVNSRISRSDLGASLARYETALERMHSARQGLKEENNKIVDINSRFPKE